MYRTAFSVLVLALFLVQGPQTFALGQTPRSTTDNAGHRGSSKPIALKFSFQDAPWPEVLKWLASQAELTLDLTDTPNGTFNYQDDSTHTIPEAIDILNGYLLPRGYVMVRRDKFLAVLKTSHSVLPSLIPLIPISKLEEYGDNELVRVVVDIAGLDAEQVSSQVSGILGPHGQAIPLNASESLILQGFGKTLRETVKLLSSAAVPASVDELVFRAFQLESISATDAERQIQNLFGLASNPYQASIARRQAYERSRYRGRDNDDRDRQRGPTPLVANLSMNLKVSALKQSNSLLVTSTPAAIELIEDILETIDIRPENRGDEMYNDNTPVLRVYTVEDADEDDVAETLDAVMPGVVINEDGRHNSIHILATPVEHREVEKLIRVIDGGGTGGGVEIIRLTRNDPYEMSDLLSSLFENEDRDDRPVITPEPRNSSIVIRATSSQMAEIKKTLAAYGETTTVGPTTNMMNRFRTLDLSGHGNAERVANVVQELLQENRNFSNRIRVIVPSDSKNQDQIELQDRVERFEFDNLTTPNQPGASEDVIDIRQRTGNEIHNSKGWRGDVHLAESRLPVSSKSRDEQGISDIAPDAQNEKTPSVTIEVRDNKLFLYSNDGIALDQVEETIRELVRQMPSRTQWTVFYLKAAAAEQTAQNLVELLQDGISPSPMIGIATEPAGARLGTQPTRIIPDARTNALFMSGPESQIQQAANFLKFLDTTQLPESLRDRIPRSIPVSYADVTEVAEMIRELYKDFMVDPEQVRREQRRNDRDREDRERTVTASSSKTAGLQPPGIRLTLAVDEEAQSLLVSCNEQLYQQIRDLVRERDEAARERRPTVRVIQLKELGTNQVESMLDNLSPRISVSSTEDNGRNQFRSSQSNDRRENDRRNNDSRERDDD